MSESEWVVILFLVFFGLHFILERWLSWLNTRNVMAHRHEVPAALQGKISQDAHTKSVAYSFARARFGHVAATLGAIGELVFLFSGVFPWLFRTVTEHAAHLPWQFLNDWQHVTGFISNGVALILLCAAIGSLLSLPLDLYSTFVLEARFGFNKTDLKTFILDRIKGAIVGGFIGVPFLFGLLAFMTHTGSAWWIWATLFVIGFQLVMVLLYPLVIAPIFNKFTPLQDGELKTRLEELAKKCDFAAQGIFVMDGSKRSGHSNAYFTGFGRARRIVIYDTLIQQLSVDELASVLAHEIGHYKRGHIPRMLILSSLMTLAGFFVLSLLLPWLPMYRAFGFPLPDVAVGLILFAMLAGHFTFWTGPLFHALSRKHEYEADAYASQHAGGPKPMEGALIKLHEKNLSNVTPHPLYSAYHYSHPTLLERITALEK